jgi:Domain of unknown function (DUF4340)
MTESTKTIFMAAAAAVLLVVAIVARPKPPYVEPEGVVGKPLFATNWSDPRDARSMQMTTFDETTQAANDFQVALVDGKWAIPSHGNYPANAQEHVNKAANALINLTVLDVVTDEPRFHEQYGVVEPDPAKIKGLAYGVGKLVTVKDKDGNALARLVVGKQDKASGGSETSSVRFVRKAGQDRVYKVKLDGDLFSTKFADWIDPDLLDLKQHWDITKMQIHDNDLEDTGDRIGVVRKDDIDLAYNDQKGSWSVGKLVNYKEGKPVESKLAADEELDTTKLNDAKMNLSGLKIADVAHKPDSLADKLKKNKEFFDDKEARESLGRWGFVADSSKKPPEIVAGGGDFIVGMKDGVEYTVRFGTTRHTLSEGGDSKAKKDESKTGDETKRAETIRRVFVTARFNEDLIPKPTLEKVPEAKPAEMKPSDKKPGESKPDEKKPADKAAPAKPPAAGGPTNKAPDSKKPDGRKSADAPRPELLLALADDAQPPAAAKGASKAAPPSGSPGAAGAPKPPAAGATTTGKAPEAAKGDAANNPADAKKPDAGAKTGADKNAPSDLKRADEEKARDAERQRIEADNKRKTDDYNATVKKGKERAKQLNDRFADWYYFITEDDYKKIHVGRAEIVKKKPAPEGASGTTPTPGLGPGLTDPFQQRGTATGK